MVSSGAETNGRVHPILVDADGRVYVNLNSPAAVERADTTVTHPEGIGIFGKQHVNNQWTEMPVAVYTSTDANKGTWIIPVTPMTAEREEGVKIRDVAGNIQPTGDATARPLFVRITDGTTDALVDPDLGALLTVPIEHNLVADGVVFSCFHSFLLTPAATSKWLHVKVPATHIAHMRFRFMSEAKIDYYVYEAPTLTNDGTALTEFDINRVTANASNVDVFHTPTITAVGTMIDNGMIGTNGFLSDTGGSVSPMRDWLFKASESYLIGANNNDAAAKDFVIQLSWYEDEV